MIVERVQEKFAVEVDRASIHDIAAGHPLRSRRGFRLKFPFDRGAWLSQVERVESIWVWRYDVHRVVDNDGSGLVTSQETGGESPCQLEALHIGGVDLIKGAVTCARVILGGHQPLAVIRLILH